MKVYCPYCRKDVEYKVEKRNVNEFRGTKIDTYENVAICKVCNQDLYVNDIEEKNNARMIEAYRKKTNIIKPQDIIDLRKKYNISQRELTAILGFGKMTINRYERGGVPTKSQSDYMRLLIENDNKFVEKVKDAYKNGSINEKTYKRIVSTKIENKVNSCSIQDMYRIIINNSLKEKPNIYNGYKSLDLDVVENIISYISSKVKNLTITSLNKYLWFVDSLSFNLRGISITGLTYQKQQYGPTILDQKYVEISLLDDKYKRNDYDNETGTVSFITSNKNYDLSRLKDSEIEIINTIIKLLKTKSVKDISEMSHKEEGWKKTKMYEKISFEYAMKLNMNK